MENRKPNYFDLIAMAQNEYDRLLKAFPELTKLTKREFEIFSHLLSDKTQAQIAKELFVSHSSVHFHCKNIYKKLDISSRRQLLITYRDLCGQ